MDVAPKPWLAADAHFSQRQREADARASWYRRAENRSRIMEVLQCVAELAIDFANEFDGEEIESVCEWRELAGVNRKELTR